MDDDRVSHPASTLTAEHIARLLKIYDTEIGTFNEEDIDEFWHCDAVISGFFTSTHRCFERVASL
jgi:hypothetical protein